MNYQDELKGEQIANKKFSSDRFIGANLKFTSFTKCIFENCDFSGVLFDGASFEDCSFPGSKLSNLDFAPVIFIKCNFAHSVVENSIFQKIKLGSKCETGSYDLRECVFAEVSLLNTIWVKCDLEKISFENAKLSGGIFDRCKLTKASFKGADISGTNFETSTIDQTELDMQGFVQYGNSRGFKLCL